jgi:hypothetical protein
MHGFLRRFVSSRYQRRFLLDHRDSWLSGFPSHDVSTQDLLQEIRVDRPSARFCFEIKDLGQIYWKAPPLLAQSGAVFFGRTVAPSGSSIQRKHPISSKGRRAFFSQMFWLRPPQTPVPLSQKPTVYTDLESFTSLSRAFFRRNCRSISLFFDDVGPEHYQLCSHRPLLATGLPLIAHLPSQSDFFTLNRVAKEFDHLIMHFIGTTEFSYPGLLRKLLRENFQISLFVSDVSWEAFEHFAKSYSHCSTQLNFIYSPGPPSLGSQPTDLKSLPSVDKSKVNALIRNLQAPVWIA